jgi:hypothetical protein
MSQVRDGGAAGAAAGSAVCPNCEGILSAGSVCWRCCDRPCAGCGRLTGSAFILYCWPCSYRAAGEGTPKAGPELALH